MGASNNLVPHKQGAVGANSRKIDAYALDKALTESANFAREFASAMHAASRVRYTYNADYRREAEHLIRYHEAAPRYRIGERLAFIKKNNGPATDRDISASIGSILAIKPTSGNVSKEALQQELSLAVASKNPGSIVLSLASLYVKTDEENRFAPDPGEMLRAIEQATAALSRYRYFFEECPYPHNVLAQIDEFKRLDAERHARHLARAEERRLLAARTPEELARELPF